MTRRTKLAGRRFPRAAKVPCALCGGLATQDDFCVGCGKHVCERCDHPDHPDPDERPQLTAHDVQAHNAARGVLS